MTQHRSDMFFAAAQPVIEVLEERRLLSASVEGGILAVQGTDANDVITISVTPGRIKVDVNGERKIFKTKGVNIIEVKAGLGNDQVRLGSNGRISAQLDGGAGNDILIGGRANDILAGGAGSDSLSGGGGNDQIKGGLGDDDIQGGAGNDSLLGEAGNDDVSGDDGNDDLDGGAGNDAVDGGGGRDMVRGGKGKDVFSNRDAAKERRDQHKILDASEVTVLLNQLPPAVTAAFSAKYGEVKLRKVGADTEEAVAVYIFDFLDGQGLRYKAKFDAAGTFIREWAIGKHRGPAVPVTPEVPQDPEPEDPAPEEPEAPQDPLLV